LLPKSTDAAWFGGEFERIKAGDFAELKRQRDHALDQVQACEETLAKLSQFVDRNAVIAHRIACQTRADFIARHQPRWKTWRYIELLVLGKRAGVALSYTSEPVPHGPGVAYLRAAAAAVGAPLSAHRAGWLLNVYGKMQPAAAAMHVEGGMRANSKVIEAKP
jgi:hypothetical protein